MISLIGGIAILFFAQVGSGVAALVLDVPMEKMVLISLPTTALGLGYLILAAAHRISAAITGGKDEEFWRDKEL